MFVMGAQDGVFGSLFLEECCDGYETQDVAELPGAALSVGMADTSTSRVACQAS